MILVEYRESAYNKAFDLLEKAKESNKMTKLALCDLYDCLQDCYESEMSEDYDEEYVNVDGGDSNTANIDNIEIDEINYRGNMRRNMRRNFGGMRSRNGMRRNMRSSMHHNMGRYSY